MKTQILLGALSLLMTAPTAALGQVEVIVDQETAAQPHTQQNGPKQEWQGEGKTMRASQLVGLNVTNGQDETDGEVNDLVMDDHTGQVKYVALSVGGFLGIGDKLFAIPYHAFDIRKNEDQEVMATLNATKNEFENAEAFDTGHWPSMGDQQWRARNDKSYKSMKRYDRYDDERKEMRRDK